MPANWPAPTAIEADAVTRLGDDLAATGYAEFCATFSPLAPRLERWAEHRPDAPPDLRGVIDLFLLGRPASLDSLPPRLRGTAQELAEVGVLVSNAPGTVRTPGLVLLPVLGYWLFFQRPTRDPKLYFGDDSVALACRVRPRHGGATLDLCAGPGIQSLVASSFSASVTAVEINPIASQIARLNAVINRRDDRITVLDGDLFAPLPPGERFDHITANPPLLPVPPGLRYPFVGDGGVDGLAVTRRILEGLPAHLADGGSAQIIATSLSDGVLPFIAEPLAKWCANRGMDLRLTVAAHVPLRPGTPMFDGLAATAGSAEAPGLLQEFLTVTGATHLATCFLLVQHGGGHLTIQDMSREWLSGLWFI